MRLSESCQGVGVDMQGLCCMFRAVTVDCFILLLSYSISSGAREI